MKMLASTLFALSNMAIGVAIYTSEWVIVIFLTLIAGILNAWYQIEIGKDHERRF